MCMVIRHENMVFKDRRTEEQEGLLARGKTGEQKNIWIACGDKTEEQKNMFFG